MQLSEAHRPLATLAISFHEISKHRIGQHRHMAENVVENVRLLKIVELFFRPDEGARREAAIGEMVEEHLIRHQFRHGHDTPAGQLFQLV